MLRRYSQWMGDTLRRTLIDRSSGSPSGPIGGRMAAGGAPTSSMQRSQFRSYSARACFGMSEAG